MELFRFEKERQAPKGPDLIIIGCGLCGSVIARQLADASRRVLILEKRNHIAGNLYDYRDENGFLIQKYGPHTFHTNNRNIYEYISRFEEWEPFCLKCGAVIDGRVTPTPFNFHTIDQFFKPNKAALLKNKLRCAYVGREKVSIIELLENQDPDIQAYARFLFDKDYSLYAAKQWGVPPSEIDPSVLKRVPVRLSYGEGYFDEPYQVMPRHSFSHFIKNIITHPNICVKTGVDAMDHICLDEACVAFNGRTIPVVFTGPIDLLFGHRFGKLPYRSLRFEFKHAGKEGVQKYPVTAYPQEKGFTRIADYRHLPEQPGFERTTYAVEYPLPYEPGRELEPYYPLLTESSQEQYEKYAEYAKKFDGLFCCGRLAEYKYYNMDQALERALAVAKEVIGWLARMD